MGTQAGRAKAYRQYSTNSAGCLLSSKSPKPPKNKWTWTSTQEYYYDQWFHRESGDIDDFGRNFDKTPVKTQFTRWRMKSNIEKVTNKPKQQAITLKTLGIHSDNNMHVWNLIERWGTDREMRRCRWLSALKSKGCKTRIWWKVDKYCTSIRSGGCIQSHQDYKRKKICKIKKRDKRKEGLQMGYSLSLWGKRGKLTG